MRYNDRNCNFELSGPKEIDIRAEEETRLSSGIGNIDQVSVNFRTHKNKADFQVYQVKCNEHFYPFFFFIQA